MYHELLRDASFWEFLFSVDEDLAETAGKRRCSCGGRLHRANYLRKPRGGPRDLPKQCRLRFSYCCDQDGCRKRATPRSVRFLGRKVYLAAVVILVSAMQQGPSRWRVEELSRLFGADRRTISRWQAFWRDHFPRTAFWKVARARLVPAVEVIALPLSLLQAFVCADDPNDIQREGWKGLLIFLAPITITGGLAIKIS